MHAFHFRAQSLFNFELPLKQDAVHENDDASLGIKRLATSIIKINPVSALPRSAEPHITSDHGLPPTTFASIYYQKAALLHD